MNGPQQKRKQTFHKRNSGNNNQTNQAKRSTVVIQTLHSISQFPKSQTHCSLDYATPSDIINPVEPNFDLPAITARSASVLSRQCKLLGPTFLHTSRGHGVSLSNDLTGQELSEEMKRDPLINIILQKRSTKKVIKIGSHAVDIFAKDNRIIPDNPVMKAPTSTTTNTTSTGNKLISRLFEKETFQTPAKRIRDEIIDASSSMKKNRRTLEISTGGNDTTMELSFEGKAMDKSDLVKLVDSSGIMTDDSNLPDASMHGNGMTVDTKNLLQNEFHF